MLILGIDTTTLSCSAALLRSGILLSEMTLNIKKTHSERLMPLIDCLLKESGIEREELKGIAVAAGPGSFTGLRIGLATARALAQGLAIPAVPVCTLSALASAVPVPGFLISPLLDARRSQVYAALYERNPEPPYKLVNLIEPAARDLQDYLGDLKQYDRKVLFTGEGLNSYEKVLNEGFMADHAVLAPPPFRLCRASFVAQCGRELLEQNPRSSYEELLPIYLRQSEAERLEKKKKAGKEGRQAEQN